MKIHQQKHNLILYPTNDRSNIVLHNESGNYYPFNLKKQEKQHIYILSDERIKVGDWLMSIFNGKPQYVDKCTEVDEYDTFTTNYNGELIKWTSGKHCKKIIATTNPDLGVVKYTEGGHVINAGRPVQLPQFTNSFVLLWITNGCPEQVNIDFYQYWEMVNNKWPNYPQFKPVLSETNTINCSLIEEQSFSKGEILFAAHLARNYNPSETHLPLEEFIIDEINKVRQSPLTKEQKFQNLVSETPSKFIEKFEVIKSEQEIGQLFENNFDCYADTWKFDDVTGLGIEGDMVMAMTKEKFIELYSAK